MLGETFLLHKGREKKSYHTMNMTAREAATTQRYSIEFSSERHKLNSSPTKIIQTKANKNTIKFKTKWTSKRKRLHNHTKLEKSGKKHVIETTETALYMKINKFQGSNYTISNNQNLLA